MTGWACPRCSRVFSPITFECRYCNDEKRMQWQPMKTAPTEKWGRVIGWCVYPAGAEPRIVQLNHLGDWMYNECKQNVTAWMPLPSEPIQGTTPCP